MPDHFLESGDSPDLEALFDQVASSRQAPPVAAPPVADSGNGDSPDLQALFDEVSASCQQQPVAAATPAAAPPAAPGQLTETGDSPELQSLFEQVAADYTFRLKPSARSRRPSARPNRCIPVSAS